MPAPAEGTLDGTTVVVADEAQANRLYNKGYIGTPETGNTLRLQPCEAAWAIMQRRLRLDIPLEAVLALGDEANEVEVLAYTDLRDRGLVCRPHEDGLAVWQRGAHPPQAADWYVWPCAERRSIRAQDLLNLADQGRALAIADEDGAVTYYTLARAEPNGTCFATDLEPRTGTILADRVWVPDAADWQKDAFIGEPRGDALMLSFAEASYLQKEGALNVPDVPGIARQRQPQFALTEPVYCDLRARGVVARSGFRFGTHLRGYKDNPNESHAAWLLHCADADQHIAWPELSRGVRLAHGVRKEFLVAVTHPTGGTVDYLSFAWLRP